MFFLLLSKADEEREREEKAEEIKRVTSLSHLLTSMAGENMRKQGDEERKTDEPLKQRLERVQEET